MNIKAHMSFVDILKHETFTVSKVSLKGVHIGDKPPIPLIKAINNIRDKIWVKS